LYFIRKLKSTDFRDLGKKYENKKIGLGGFTAAGAFERLKG
jgi:hypothetical protein